MKRIQRKRTKGWKMPDNCKYVGRPTKWGNPFKLTPDGWIMVKSINRKILDPWVLWSSTGVFCLNDICDLYKMWITGRLQSSILPKPPTILELRGLDLACFCSLSTPCHADVLIELLT